MSKKSATAKVVRRPATEIPKASKSDLDRLRAAMRGKIDTSDIPARKNGQRIKRLANGRLPRRAEVPQASYAQLDKVLRSLGFSRQLVDQKAILYRNEGAGALVALPLLNEEQQVWPRHLLAVRSILQAYGITDPTDFAARLLKAS